MTDAPVMSTPRRLASIGWAMLFSAAALVALAYLTPDTPIRFWADARNAAHVVVSAVLLIAIVWNFRKAFPDPIHRPRVYAAAFIFAIIVSTTAEFLQASSTRTPDVWDLARNFAGLVVGLCVFWFMEQISERRRTPLRVSALVALVALVALTIALAEIASTTWAYYLRQQSMPVVYSASDEWADIFATEMNSRVSYRRKPPSFHEYGGPRVLTLVSSDRSVSGLVIEPEQDWSGYSRLNLKLFNPGQKPVTIIVRLDDRFRAWESGEWWARKIDVPPGGSTEFLDLSDRRIRTSERRLDLSHVRRILIHVAERAPGTTMFFGELLLE